MSTVTTIYSQTKQCRFIRPAFCAMTYLNGNPSTTNGRSVGMTSKLYSKAWIDKRLKSFRPATATYNSVRLIWLIDNFNIPRPKQTHDIADDLLITMPTFFSRKPYPVSSGIFHTHRNTLKYRFSPL